jgi:septal ring factor EnvC (AmiA/AmiB activator)
MLFLSAQVTLSGQQHRKKLEQQKSELKKEIAYKSKLLGETEKNKKSTLNQLLLLKKQIISREQLIQTLRREIAYLEREISLKEKEITEKSRQLDALKEHYAQMIYNSFKTRHSYDKVMFILASRDFNQAYLRLKYLEQYRQYRRDQAALIEKTADELAAAKSLLHAAVEEKNATIAENTAEKVNLDKDRQQRESVVNDLTAREKEIKAEIKRKEKEAYALQKAIEKVIAEELARQKKNAKGGYELTPEALALSSNFASNKGKLPWPIEKGVVTDYFGEHWHPVLKGIKINNKGVDISTDPGATARALFEGTVSMVLVLPGAGRAVMLRHGEYITVYSNLADVYVQKGDKVQLKQKIGTVLTNDDQGKTEVHLEIWKGQTALNPGEWLYKFK